MTQDKPRRVTRRATLPLPLLAAAAAAQAGGLSKKRRAPVDVPPLVVGGLRYEAPFLGTPFGYAQDGGIVVARHADTDALEWTRRIYTTVRDPHMESDKQDVFIQSLTLSADGQRLAIVDERGRRYELGLDGAGLRALP